MTLTRSTKYHLAPAAETIEIDATGKHLGRLATQIAVYLRGKHRATFTPHQPAPVKVVVTNASQVFMNPKALQFKQYRTYSGHPGGAKYVPAATLLQKDPAKVIRLAVERMLPRNRWRDKQLRRLIITR